MSKREDVFAVKCIARECGSDRAARLFLRKFYKKMREAVDEVNAELGDEVLKYGLIKRLWYDGNYHLKAYLSEKGLDSIEVIKRFNSRLRSAASGLKPWEIKRCSTLENCIEIARKEAECRPT